MEGCTRANNNTKFRHRHTSYPTIPSSSYLFCSRSEISTNMLIFTHQQTCLILSPVFVSLLQSQIIAFAVQCRSFTPSLWTERSLNKSQNRQFTIITMYQVTFCPNSSRRTSLHWGRWLTGINTPLSDYLYRRPTSAVFRLSGSATFREKRPVSITT